MADIIQYVKKSLNTFRFRFASEKEFQDGINRVFTEYGFAHKREHPLGRGDIPDFLIPDFNDEFGQTLAESGLQPRYLAVEVKTGGSPAAVARQLSRYAGYTEVEAVLLITSKSTLAKMPETLQGKLIYTIVLSGAF